MSERLQRLEDEAAILDTFRRYQYFYDASDIDGVATCFTEDGVQINGRGTFVGRDQLRASYRYLVDHQRLAIHHGTNTIVRFDEQEPSTQAWLTSVFLCFYADYEDQAAYVGGTYVMRMLKTDEEWLIAEHRITYNYRCPVDAVSRQLHPNPPAPDGALSTRDLIEDRYQLA
ncbi:MAG: nuclear transport factor 2 family protein [Nocardioidaceae bacterium]